MIAEQLEVKNVRLELELEIVADAERASTDFWRTWLWQARELRACPSSDFCARLAEHFEISTDDVRREWLAWYDLLTSWDLAAALVGHDVRSRAAPYGLSHRRA